MERNPYDILGLTPASSKAEITKAMAVAMKQKAYPIDEIAKAQKALMKPEERLAADFLRPILLLFLAHYLKCFPYHQIVAFAQLMELLL